MGKDIEVRGVDEFLRVAKALKAQGSAGRGLQRELKAAIQSAAEPMVDEVRRSAVQYLPDRYAEEIRRDLKARQSWKTRGKQVGLRITGYAKGRGSRRAVGDINRGVLRGPTFGNWDAARDQRVRAGFWDEPLMDAREKPARAMRRAIQEVSRKIGKAG